MKGRLKREERKKGRRERKGGEKEREERKKGRRERKGGEKEREEKKKGGEKKRRRRSITGDRTQDLPHGRLEL